MRLIITRCKRRPGYPLWAVALVAGWLSAVGMLTLHGKQTGHEMTLCLFKRFTGYPCPTCGMTRGVVALIEGRPIAALAMNPLMMVVLLAAVALLLLRLISGYQIRFEPSPRMRRMLWPLLGTFFILNWAYLVWQHV